MILNITLVFFILAVPEFRSTLSGLTEGNAFCRTYSLVLRIDETYGYKC
jgi:hypothetical protein